MTPGEHRERGSGPDDEPTDVMPGGPDELTGVNPPGNEPTEVNQPGAEPTGRIPEGSEDPTGALSPPRGPDGPGGGAADEPGGTGRSGRGVGVLVVAILASLALGVAYVAAGGPVGPSEAADPCDARPWTDPGNLEETAQQFALSAADGAACELGVSREELTRSIAEERTRQEFMDDHGFSESDLEEALRAGLNRAVDDAENAGALDSLAATGIRAAIRVMPMSVMIGLLENADGIFSGDFGSLGGLGEAIDAITGGLDDLGSGEGGNSRDDLGGVIEGLLPDGATDSFREQIPDDLRERLEDEAQERIRQGLEGLFER